MILRAAGGLLLAGGWCVLAMPLCAIAQSTATKSTTTNPTAAKPAASAKSTSASQMQKTGTPVKSTASSGKSVKKKPGSASRAARTRMQMAPTADRIKEIQTALAASASYKGEPNGKWDDASIAAMKHFQQVNGLNPSGKLDALSLQKLGLGSDTAGRGAPRIAKPTTSPASTTTPTIQR